MREAAKGLFAIHRRTGVRVVAGLVGLSLMNGLSLSTVPLSNGAWARELGLGASLVGVLLTVQILIAAIVGIALSSRLHRLDPRRWGMGAGLLLLGASVELAFARESVALFAGMVATGLALGVLTAAAAAAIAAADRVERTSAIVTLATTLVVAALTLPLAQLTGAGATRGLFLGQALIVVFSLALTTLLPGRRVDVEPPPSVGLMEAVRSPLVFSFVAQGVGSTGIWAFTLRIGAGLGLSAGAVGEIIAGASLAGILGAAAAAALARPGRILALSVGGVTLFGLATTLIPLAPVPAVFVMAMVGQAFFFVFCTPFLTAFGVSLDRSGGLVAAAQSWSNLLSAAAPAVAGFLLAAHGPQSLAWLSAGAATLAVASLLLAARARRE